MRRGSVDVIAFWRRLVNARRQLVADDKGAGGRFNHVIRDGLELIDFEDSSLPHRAFSRGRYTGRPFVNNLLTRGVTVRGSSIET